jgi:hypothetical protein
MYTILMKVQFWGRDCSAYGSSQSNERGMPDTNIINSLSKYESQQFAHQQEKTIL